MTTTTTTASTEGGDGFDQGWLDVGSGHQLWYGQYGNPEGLPLLWVHGGPGSGASLRIREVVDLQRYRLVLFDQRGCSRSAPAGELRSNTTTDLVDDMLRICTQLGLTQPLVGGGSWGATLALLFAQRFPTVPRALVIRSPFLATEQEITAFFSPRPNHDPDWNIFSEVVNAQTAGDVLAGYAAVFNSGGAPAAQAARAWYRYQCLRESGRVDAAPPRDGDLVVRYRIQAHYLRHGCFLAPDWLDANSLSNVPVPMAILHGSEDRICPLSNASKLKLLYPHSRIRVVTGAGHDPFHLGMAKALRTALDCLATDGDLLAWTDDGAGNA